MSNRYSTKTPSGSKSRLQDLLLNSDNHICADCGAPDPKWASADIGVFLCLRCSEVHRTLGSHISKVLSVTLDEWSDEEIESMVEVGGNACANAVYEEFLPPEYSKPGPDSSTAERTIFIRAKYEAQEFLKPSLRVAIADPSVSSLQQNDPIEDTEDAGEFIGTLNVKVVKGTNLAVRDMQTSDPYVVLLLGNQRAQTSVISSDLNPVWIQDLKLSVPQQFGPLKVQVYDHDTFSANDIMGEADIDLQPMINAAMVFGNTELLGNMQIGKWLKTSDNALIDDSIVNIVDGKVKQEVSLQLQNVESGELELELEWNPLD